MANKKTYPKRDETTKNHITVVEFSLTHDARKILEEKLTPYLNGQPEDLKALAAIAQEALGERVIEELKNLGKKDESANDTVYVIHNLPEVSDAKAKELYQDVHSTLFDKDTKKTYSHYMMAGLVDLLSFNTNFRSDLTRRRQDSDPIRRNSAAWLPGRDFHGHNADASALAGLISDDSPTQFLNIKTAKEDPKTANVEIFDGKDHMPLSNYARQIYQKIPMNPSLENALSGHTRNVVVGKHDVILWKERGGHLMHRSTPSKPSNGVHDPDEITRIVKGYFLKNATLAP